MFRVQVVFAGLIDHAKLVKSGRCFIRDDLIDLAKGSGVALIADTDDELSFAFYTLARANAGAQDSR